MGVYRRQSQPWHWSAAGKVGEVDELGGAAIFLVSDASSFMTGQIIYIEGDMTGPV
ncbi:MULTISPECIES: SDR family oxidoreductase [unclassified Mesorhizobium]|uniref:SDR family oxidoreductase n=1 Tax=unclassified Mesorhizobium TaxID=325217 RepID=UPI00333618D4